MAYLLAQASAHRIPLRDESVQTCVTSPPYWGLRAYAGEQGVTWPDGTTHPLGLEPTPDLFVAHMVEVFREVRRVLRKDGTLWLNLGDSYAGSWGAQSREHAGKHAPNVSALSANQVKAAQRRESHTGSIPPGSGLKPKDLVGIPWRVAFALQADGWYLRSDIVWAKPNPMPESVTDRPTKSHEYLFLMSKEPRYFYDADAIREVAIHEGHVVKASNPETAKNAQKGVYGATAAGFSQHDTLVSGRNARSVWNIATQPYPGAHFATFPEELPERCIKAGSAAQACSVCGAPWERVTEREYRSSIVLTGTEDGRFEKGRNRNVTRMGDGVDVHTLGFEPTCAHDAPTVGSVVIDPFNGSGTTGRVAMRLGRRYVGLDLSREYLVEQAVARIDPIAAAARDFREQKDGAQGALL